MFGMCTVVLTRLNGKEQDISPLVRSRSPSVGDIIECETANGAVVRASISNVTHNPPTIQTAASLGSWDVYAEEIPELRCSPRSGDQTGGRCARSEEMKFVTDRPLADPAVAARKLLELANAVEPVHIHIEKINAPFMYKEGGTPEEYRAGLDYAIAKGCLWKHESGTYVKFTDAGALLFA